MINDLTIRTMKEKEGTCAVLITSKKYRSYRYIV
jgi:hypothetical protein